MKVPLAWNDKTLLNDEPFLNAFSRRAKAREGPKKDHEAWRTRVMTNLQRQDGIVSTGDDFTGYMQTERLLSDSAR